MNGRSLLIALPVEERGRQLERRFRGAAALARGVESSNENLDASHAMRAIGKATNGVSLTNVRCAKAEELNIDTTKSDVRGAAVNAITGRMFAILRWLTNYSC